MTSKYINSDKVSLNTKKSLQLIEKGKLFIDKYVKKNWPFFLLLPAFFFLSDTVTAQANKSTPSHQSTEFPVAWAGEWTGELEIFRGPRLMQSIPVYFQIAPQDTSDNFTWRTIYDIGNEEKKIAKDYELTTLDKEKGWYAIDEKNSIVIEAYLLDNKLVSWFEVQGTTIVSTYELRSHNELYFEILAGSSKAVSTTGGETIDEGEDIPEVLTYPLSTLQRALLRRKE